METTANRIGKQLPAVNNTLARERRNLFFAAQEAQIPLKEPTDIPPLAIGIVTNANSIPQAVTTETGLTFDLHTQESLFGELVIGIVFDPNVFIAQLPPEFQSEAATSLPFGQMVDQLEATALSLTAQAISFTFTGSTEKASRILEIYSQDFQYEKSLSAR